MCGILGALSDGRIKGTEVKKALNQQKNRGPDDEGYRDLSKDKNYVGPDTINSLEEPNISQTSSDSWLGHRRLSITGGKDCHQPMSYKNLSITFEGEIYNYQSIRQELAEAGHSFETKGDTEVFLHAFEEWGISCLKKFEGKWAAGIHNSETRELYCIRDHFGTKPLYYSYDDGDFFFSSTISPILELKDQKPAEDTQAKLDYLVKSLADHSCRTFFEDVKQLRPGQYLKFSDGEISIGRIPRKETSKDNLRELCIESIKSKIPEKNWCITLSGGLDSSIVASVLSEENEKVYSADINNGLYESAIYREKVAEENDLDMEEISISRKELVDNIEESMPFQEEPTLMLPAQAQNILLKQISSDGKKVVLTGSGADELFLGYRTFVPEGIAETIKKEGLIDGLTLLKGHRSNLQFKDLLYIIYLILPFNTREWIKTKISYSQDDFIDTTDDLSSLKNPETLHDSVNQQIESFWYPTIKRQADKNAGQYGLELRESFLSQELLNYVETHQPVENIRHGKTKKTLRESFRQMLPEIVYNREEKTGFMETDDRAMTPEIKEEFLNKFRSKTFRSRSHIRSERVIHALEEGSIPFDKAYRLYNYEIWARTFLD